MRTFFLSVSCSGHEAPQQRDELFCTNDDVVDVFGELGFQNATRNTFTQPAFSISLLRIVRLVHDIMNMDILVEIID